MLIETRNEIELMVTAGSIPEKIVVDLSGTNIHDTIHISNVTLPAGSRPTISDRDFAVASIQPPSGLSAAEEDEAAEG